MTQLINGAAANQWIGIAEIKRLEEQNIACKHLLAEVLKKEIHHAQLDYLEYYQSRFVELDEKMRRLKADLQLFEAPAAYSHHQEQHIRMAPQGLAFSIKMRYDALCKDIAVLSAAFRAYLDGQMPG